MDLISNFRWAFGFSWMISVLMSLGQSCAMHVTKKTDPVVKPDLSPLIIDKFKFGDETGIDFMQNFKVEFYEELRFDINPYGKILETQNETKALDMVQRFLRKIKGLPETPLEDENLKIGSGSDSSLKPAWCYHPFELKELAKVEIKIYRILKQIHSEKINVNSFPALESYLKDIEESSLKVNFTEEQLTANDTVTDVNEDPFLYIAAHPILVYRLIRRFAVDLQPILVHLKFHHRDLVMRLHQDANPNSLVFPEETDFDDAFLVIGRIQYTNMLDTFKLAKGKLENVNTGIQLNALHALEIGAFVYDINVYDYAIEWLYFALETLRQSPEAKTYPGILRFIEDLLELAVSKHNNNWGIKMKNRWRPCVFNSTVTLPFEPSMYTRLSTALNPLASQQRHVTDLDWAVNANFRRVCAGENLQSEVEKAALKCWYRRPNNHPYWIIHPLKTELLARNPPVIQIYDFVEDKLMKKIKTAALPELRRSGVVAVHTTNNKTTNVDAASVRTSSQTWFSEENGALEFLVPLTIKMELMSGLRILAPHCSESYQVVSYGPSHHFHVHRDSFADPSISFLLHGNRITTIMIYLSDVEVGGRTGFPVLGVFANPVKGSVLMWNNLKRNGEDRETRTWHGGCPVTLGVKWIANKWIWYEENAFQFKCTLNPSE